MKFKQPYDYANHVKDREVNNLPSLTIPDQTMSIPELIRRYAQGLPLGAPRVPMYDDVEVGDLLQGRNWNTLDLTERAEIMKNVSYEVQDIITKESNRRKGKTKPELSTSNASDVDSSEDNVTK